MIGLGSQRSSTSHYKTKQPFSPALIQKIIKSRYVNVELSHLGQVFCAKFDIKVHTDQESEDYTLLWNNLREKIFLMKRRNFTQAKAPSIQIHFWWLRCGSLQLCLLSDVRPRHVLYRFQR